MGWSYQNLEFMLQFSVNFNNEEITKQAVSQIPWGSKYIQNLANDLKEYGKGYSVQNIKYMSQIACEYTIGEISHQPGCQIPWFTMIRIISKSKSHDEVLYYINKTHKKGLIDIKPVIIYWSR